MPKFLADSFHAHSHLLAIFKGLCIFILRVWRKLRHIFQMISFMYKLDHPQSIKLHILRHFKTETVAEFYLKPNNPQTQLRY